MTRCIEKLASINVSLTEVSQPTFICLKSTIVTVEKSVKYVQS